MASTVHHNSHQALLLRPLPTPSRHPRLSFSPRPAGLRSFFPASGCRLGTHGVALAEPEFVPLQEEEEEEEDARFVVVTFYKFVPLFDPHAEVARHLNFLQGRDIHGRIYLNEKGINAQYSGPHKDAVAYADWVKKHHQFSDMLVQTSPAVTGHAFPRLKLRYKPSLVQEKFLALCFKIQSRSLYVLVTSLQIQKLIHGDDLPQFCPQSPEGEALFAWVEGLGARGCADEAQTVVGGARVGVKVALVTVDGSREGRAACRKAPIVRTGREGITGARNVVGWAEPATAAWGSWAMGEGLVALRSRRRELEEERRPRWGWGRWWRLGVSYTRLGKKACATSWGMSRDGGEAATLEGGSLHLPLLDPNMRATPLTPSEWKERLEARTCLDVSSGETSGRGLLLLDVRNDYEWDVGHFEGAQRPNVDCFRSTSFGLSGETDPLNGVDKERTDILMYCTGGIRCDVYSTILRKKGFRNLYTLEGGVSNYLKVEGPAGWVGNLFVFDGRLSLPPATFNEEEDEEEQQENKRCCGWCAEELCGCCCSDCKVAPRLRPLLPGHQRYLKWHVYRDGRTDDENKLYGFVDDDSSGL
ncbi:Rhodanese-like domain-containing protein 8 chloroplastic [Zea mays]|uniref:Rhodanese-like domain-containing protein 8 chloroplastic n=1 Tax=Zea mays TaxID=4577 RepID=A0A1D6LCP2_MAIZE|nr:Rhodanese-like domain-containing protein 8 chloroplastic [Zea mays]